MNSSVLRAAVAVCAVSMGTHAVRGEVAAIEQEARALSFVKRQQHHISCGVEAFSRVSNDGAS